MFRLLPCSLELVYIMSNVCISVNYLSQFIFTPSKSEFLGTIAYKSTIFHDYVPI